MVLTGFFSLRLVFLRVSKFLEMFSRGRETLENRSLLGNLRDDFTLPILENQMQIFNGIFTKKITDAPLP
jgi:hypothetical protein